MSCSSHEIILTSSPDGSITAYDTFSGTVLARFTGSRSPRRGLALAGKAYIAASHISSTTAAGSIHLYNWWSSTALHQIPLPEPVAPLAATSDGLYLFAGGLSGTVHALSIPSENILKSIPAHSKPVSCLRISNDGSLLISGGDDGCIVVLPIFYLVEASMDGNLSNLILHSFVAHDGPVTSIISCFGFCHSMIISCSEDRTCKLWSLLDGTCLRKITFPCPISGVALDPTETDFHAAGSDGIIYKGCLKVKTRKEVIQGRKLAAWPQKHGAAVVSVMMVNEGKNLVSAAEDGSVYIWEVEKGHVTMALGAGMGSISELVVAGGIGDHRRCGIRTGIEMNNCGGGSGGSSYGNGRISGKSLSRPVNNNTVDVEDVLAVAMKDRSKATDMLESAIEVYERLLELILKEAKAETSKDGEKEMYTDNNKQTEDN